MPLPPPKVNEDDTTPFQFQRLPATSGCSRPALDGFRSVGGGIVMSVDDRDEVWYTTIEDLCGAWPSTTHRGTWLTGGGISPPAAGKERSGSSSSPPEETISFELRRHGITVKVVTPGPPGALDHGPQPVSKIGEQPVRDMHALVIPL